MRESHSLAKFCSNSTCTNLLLLCISYQFLISTSFSFSKAFGEGGRKSQQDLLCSSTNGAFHFCGYVTFMQIKAVTCNWIIVFAGYRSVHLCSPSYSPYFRCYLNQCSYQNLHWCTVNYWGLLRLWQLSAPGHSRELDYKTLPRSMELWSFRKALLKWTQKYSDNHMAQTKTEMIFFEHLIAPSHTVPSPFLGPNGPISDTSRWEAEIDPDGKIQLKIQHLLEFSSLSNCPWNFYLAPDFSVLRNSQFPPLTRSIAVMIKYLPHFW